MLGFDANNNKMLSTFGPASQYHAEVCMCKLQNYQYFATQVYINLLYTPLANREEILIDIFPNLIARKPNVSLQKVPSGQASPAFPSPFSATKSNSSLSAN